MIHHCYYCGGALMRVDLFVTFGQKYAREKHPSGLPAHPDVWFKFTAPTFERCHALIYDVLGPAYATSYTEDQFENHWYPGGERMHIILK